MKLTHGIPIIGVGASAGGLEAMEQFFSHVPVDCGAAFVVIQHLDPTRQGILPELLQRITQMKVVQAEEGMVVAPNAVYVIPPNKELSILHGALQLFDPVAPRGLRLPIDFFFKALAKDQQERAIGVILSGMGADGTLGLQAIKENAGMVFAQSLDSAKFDAMPRSAIDAGVVDQEARAEALWDKIASSLQLHPQGHTPFTEPALIIKAQSALEQIVFLLREKTGNDFSLYKKNTIYRRIERRIGLRQIDGIAHYVRFLRENPQELNLLFKELLIGVTKFFRDPEVWETLKADMIPALLAEYPAGKELLVWVPACSTGEEAYSLAIAFTEVLEQAPFQHRFKLQIFATDLDQETIEQARRGVYSASIVADVSPERLERFFIAEEHGYRINKSIREMVIFAAHNIIANPPFTKLDLLSCRNLLIYFGPELQKKLIRLFHYALCKHGVLLLGNAETISHFTSLFSSHDSHSRLYRRIDQVLSPVDIDFPTQHFQMISMQQQDNLSAAPLSLQSQVEQLLLNHYSLPAVLVNSDGDILYIHGRTGKYLEPATGKANLNIYAMCREGLRHDLANALIKAQRQTEAVFCPGLTISSTDKNQMINLTVQAITQPEALSGMLIILFADVVMPTRKRSNKANNVAQQTLLMELQQAREAVQSMREEMQASQEELQSTNEELTTSQEEMQSMNEELQTLNAELQAKVADLSQANNDMKNLLNSMEIATVFLDNSLNIRRFTSHATHLFKLIAGDVGRPLSDIVTALDYPQLYQDAQQVLQTLVFMEKQTKTHDDRYFEVRILPYRTQDNVIDGVVLTFIDITKNKRPI